MYSVDSRHLVPQVFELNRPLRIAFGQQGRRDFSTSNVSRSCHSFFQVVLNANSFHPF